MKSKALTLMTVAAAMVMALGLAACGGSSSSSAAASSASASSASASASSEAASSESASAASAEASASSASADATLTGADLASVGIEVALDDYDAMSALASDIQNGRATGQVVKIDGYVSNFAKGMSYSIVENNADKSGNIGTNFVIEGAEEEAYPVDGTHIIITGKVVQDGYSFTIHTLPEFIEVVE
ncbi:MAG: hypothetical protein IJ111_14045 [Eggerthellaceae bacterium]|nr:hypothetical protein [Eggerthellaceae bacterium]